MKNFTKKRGLFAAAAALLVITAMLVTTGCGNELGEGNGYSGYNDGFIPPPGKGAVRLNFNEKIENARTILPELPAGVAGVNDFYEFDFQFTPISPSGTLFKETVSLTALYEPIVLDPGTYELIIIAYYDFGSGGSDVRAVAANVPVEIIINAAQVKNQLIVLKPIDNSTLGEGDEGEFKYKIVSISYVTAAVMELTKLASLSSDYDVNLFSSSQLDSTEYTISVEAGYYYVDFIITVESGDVVTFRQIVLISQNLTSSYVFTIDANSFFGTLQIKSSEISLGTVTDHNPEIEYTTETPPPGDDSGDVSDVSYVKDAVIVVKRNQLLTLKVSNAGDYVVGKYEWYVGNTTSIDNTDEITIDTDPDGDYPYAKIYKLTVVGIFDDDKNPYSTEVLFKIVP